MKRLHTIKVCRTLAEAEAGGAPFAVHSFRELFCPAAYTWFDNTARLHGYTHRITDGTLAGYHWSDDSGRTLSLH